MKSTVERFTRFGFLTGLAILALALVSFLPEWKISAQDSVESKVVEEGGLVMMPLAILPGEGQEALVVMDRQRRKLCLYHYDLTAPAHERFKLIAVRDITQDFELENMNCGEPTPQQIRQALKDKPDWTGIMQDKSEPKEKEQGKEGAVQE